MTLRHRLPKSLGRQRETCGAQVRETHTGVVVLVGDRAYKAKKPIADRFPRLQHSRSSRTRLRARGGLNNRLAPDSYLGVAHFTDPQRWSG